MNRMRIVAIVLLALPAAGWAVAPRVALACWLAAWWWALGIVLGCYVNAWMHVLTGGAWGVPVRAMAATLSRRMPVLLGGLVFVALALKLLYPWAADDAWTRGLARPTFVQAWLTPGFFVVRLVLYGAVWWCLARPASLLTKGRAAASLIVHALVTTLAAIDIVMSLMPAWYSTAFGLVVTSAQALSGAAAVALFAPAHASSRTPVSRDLGNLLLMWCMSWAYLAFMQYLVIWSENLPREIAWYVPRVQTGWAWIGLALAVLQLFVPFLALLFRSIKDRPQRLAAVAALLLAATALDAVWLVLPSVDAHSLHGWWMGPLATAGMALLLFGGIPWRELPYVTARFGHA